MLDVVINLSVVTEAQQIQVYVRDDILNREIIHVGKDKKKKNTQRRGAKIFVLVVFHRPALRLRDIKAAAE